MRFTRRGATIAAVPDATLRDAAYLRWLKTAPDLGWIIERDLRFDPLYYSQAESKAVQANLKIQHTGFLEVFTTPVTGNHAVLNFFARIRKYPIIPLQTADWRQTSTKINFLYETRSNKN